MCHPCRECPSCLVGIGHSTCKKLSDIGVETIAQLRELPVSCLDSALTPGVASSSTGTGSAVSHVIRDLCFGIDRSPVVPTGPPQVCSLFLSFVTASVCFQVVLVMQVSSCPCGHHCRDHPPTHTQLQYRTQTPPLKTDHVLAEKNFFQNSFVGTHAEYVVFWSCC